jgi:hypothetical protein
MERVHRAEMKRRSSHELSGLITFDDEGLIRISERLLPEDRMILKLDERMRIKKTLTAKQKAFLKVHREACFE